MSQDKEIRSDAKLKNLDAEALEDLWRFRNPEKGGKKLKMEAILVEIPLRYGFTVSSGTLSEFYSWLRLKRRLDAAKERAEQARLELAKDPSLTPEDLQRVAQTVFTAESIEAKDIKGYVAIAKLRLQSEKHELERAKLASASKTKIEAGLEALFQEIKGNAKAVKLFNELKEVVAKA
jgi:hypothetical protein